MRYLLLAVTASLALAGCGGNSAAAQPAAKASPEDAYISQVERSVPAHVVEPQRDRFIELGYDACKSVANGRYDDETLAATWASTQGIERDQAAAALRSARDNLCPEV